MLRLIMLLLTALLLSSALLWRLGASAHPIAEITVDTLQDDLQVNGNCSLREAVIAANTDTAVDACPAGSGSDSISLPEGAYVLSIAGRGENAAQTGDLDLLSDITISGAAADLTSIDAAGLDRIFEIFGPASVTIKGVTLKNGDADTGFGGAISIFGYGTLLLQHAVLEHNTANRGGGLDNNGGTATLLATSVYSNTADYAGGIRSTGNLAITQSSVTANRSQFYAGGVHSEAGLTLLESTVSGNVAGTNGGGIYINLGNASLVNSTVSGNSISGGWLGGGLWIYYQAVASLEHVSVADNIGGGGIFNYHEQGVAGAQFAPEAQGNISLHNTIIANNIPYNCGRSPTSPPIHSLGYNLESADSCELAAAGDQVNTDPLLGMLQDNGGPTHTLALSAGSPAIDQADAAGCPANDQRGAPRPIGAGCDIGSFEYGWNPPAATATATSSLPTSTPSATPASTAIPPSLTPRTWLPVVLNQ